MDYAAPTHELTRVFGSFTAVDRVSLRIRRGEI
ncbi:MAG TPA: ABC transporter ATP-binding protein, partial [Peptococcaceae bacterium]|nr:ABC transporter ATP-binding protein [Peptococcaceae bacterium]